MTTPTPQDGIPLHELLDSCGFDFHTSTNIHKLQKFINEKTERAYARGRADERAKTETEGDRTNEEIANELCDGDDGSYRNILAVLNAKDREKEEAVKEAQKKGYAQGANAWLSNPLLLQ